MGRFDPVNNRFRLFERFVASVSLSPQVAGAAMKLLRDWWCRTAFGEYFENLSPIDRATFWIGVALAFAIAASFTALVHGAARSDQERGRFIAPPAMTRMAEVQP